MNILPVNQNFGSKQKVVRKLIPLSEFKGPILELNASDNEKIMRLRKEIASMEVKRYIKTQEAQKYSKTIDSKKYYTKLLDTMDKKIDELNTMVRDIKIARYKIQQNILNK